MGGEVLMALNIAGFPDDVDPALLGRIFEGGAHKVAEAGGVIAGGHTLIDREPKYGLAVTGIIDPRRVLTKGGARPGDLLVLTKPLGTGILLTAARDGLDDAGDAAGAVESMLRLNRHASHLAREAGARAMTDVTGFGLLGHAREMAARSGVRLVIESARAPALPGALAHAARGVTTGGGGRNRAGLAGHVEIDDGTAPELAELLYDPQTSGGLLVALSGQGAKALAAELESAGMTAAIVGRVEDGAGVRVV
jgi:selenide,water dikinase